MFPGKLQTGSHDKPCELSRLYHAVCSVLESAHDGGLRRELHAWADYAMGLTNRYGPAVAPFDPIFTG
jgi:hypothetical protein